MIRNYLKIAWRTFTRNKFYSLINVLGLSIGMGCLILIMLFVTDELSYDSFHEDADQIHFVGREAAFGKNINKGLSTPYPLGPAMKETIPEIEKYVITMWPGSGMVNREGEDHTSEEKIMMATESFFEVFNFPLKVGDSKTALSDPNAVVLTEEMAAKYFPNEDPLGKTIRIQRYGDTEYTVTGIAENIDQNSYLEFDFVASILGTSSVETNRESWNSSMFHTYIKLQDGVGWDQIKPKLANLVDTHIEGDLKTTFFSIPISKLYLSESDYISETGFKGSMKYIYIFSAIALFILLLACINYMNLATARAAERSREVGIRKVVGAQKGQLIRQFVGEAMITSILAFGIGLILAELMLPFFNEFVDKELTLNIIENSFYLLSLTGVALLVGVLSGGYPAIFLSRFNPSSVLKGVSHKYLSGAGLRKALVVTQFSVSTILVICTLMAFNQLNYVLDKDLGFNDEQVMYIPAQQLGDQLETFKQQIQTYSSVINASASSVVPGAYNMRMSSAFDPENEENEFSAHAGRSDAEYDDVLGLEMVAGRFFSEERSTDRDTARVINEAMLKELGWGSPQEAIGRKLSGGGEIIGVMKDFHFQSLHHKITPVFLEMKPSNASQYQSYSMIAVRFRAGQVDGLIEYLQQEWKSFELSEPFTYYFLDEKFAEQYKTDQKFGQAFTVFAGIAILIACMGLLGLAAFAAERRKKEIGVRKVLGASVMNIVGLLSKDFIKLVAVGFLIAIPIAWYAMNQWLTDFAYRIDIGASIFAVAGVATLLIALLTVSWQSIKAAVANPVDSLRSE